MGQKIFTDAESKAVIEAVTMKAHITNVLLAAIEYSGSKQCVLSTLEPFKGIPEVAATIDAVSSFEAD